VLPNLVQQQCTLPRLLTFNRLDLARCSYCCTEATEADKQLEEEADIMKHVLQKAALKAVKELAQV
jgi:hypothetical protein